MKASLFSVLALPAFFVNVLASPIAAPETAVVEKRQASDAYSIVESLYTEIQQYTGAINETAAGLNADSTADDNSTAATIFIPNIESITTAVNAATAQISALSSNATLLRRQDTEEALAELVENLLLEVSGALNNIVGTLGLTSLLSSLTLLVSSLSGLLAALEVVVNDLLALVQQLLDGLLTGLSVGLGGLVL